MVLHGVEEVEYLVVQVEAAWVAVPWGEGQVASLEGDPGVDRVDDQVEARAEAYVAWVP